MDHITITIAAATPDQIARAQRLAEHFAALSGIQSWSGALDERLPLYNIVQSDKQGQQPKVNPATAADTVPCYSLPTDDEGNAHPTDLDLLAAWLHRWPDTVKRVKIIAPRLNDSQTISRRGLINVLTLKRIADRSNSNVFTRNHHRVFIRRSD